MSRPFLPHHTYAKSGGNNKNKRGLSNKTTHHAIIEPLGIHREFRNESASSMMALRNAYNAVGSRELVNDLASEMSKTLDCSYLVVEGIANDFSQFVVDPPGPERQRKSTKSRSLSRKRLGRRRPVAPVEEDVAIEVEYMGEVYDESSFDQKKGRLVFRKH